MKNSLEPTKIDLLTKNMLEVAVTLSEAVEMTNAKRGITAKDLVADIKPEEQEAPLKNHEAKEILGHVLRDHETRHTNYNMAKMPKEEKQRAIAFEGLKIKALKHAISKL
jgi:hypothetical protein